MYTRSKICDVCYEYLALLTKRYFLDAGIRNILTHIIFNIKNKQYDDLDSNLKILNTILNPDEDIYKRYLLYINEYIPLIIFFDTPKTPKTFFDTLLIEI